VISGLGNLLILLLILLFLLRKFILSEIISIYPHKLLRDGEGFLLVYSISSRSTFERVERFREQVIRVKGTDRIPIILVGNKCDRITEREVSREEGMSMARKLECEFVESSVTHNVNIERAFFTLVRMIRANRDTRQNEKTNIIKKPDPTIFLQKKKNFFLKLLR
jgi:GTPase KRas protein